MADFVAGLTAGANLRQSRDAIREEKRRRDQALQIQGYSFDGNNNMSIRPDSAAEAAQLEAKEAAQLSKTLQGQLAAQDSDMALQEFAQTGDANAMQRALNNNPYLAQAMATKGVNMINNLDFDNDTQMLSAAGIHPSAYDTDDKRQLIKRNLYKVHNGKEWSLGMLNNAVMETGAMRRLGPQKGAIFMDNAEQFQNLVNGPRGSGLVAEGHKYEREINAAAAETGLEPDVIAAVIAAESSDQPGAVSNKGATGLMQLMEDAAAEVGVTDRLDPAQNIMGGAKYLKKQLDANGGDLSLALAAYNAGHGNVRKYGGIPPFSETQNYVQKVMTMLDNGQSYYGRRADTILGHMRARANAAAGKTNAQVDATIASNLATEEVARQATTRGIDQADRALDQKDVSLEHDAQTLVLKNRELGLKAQENVINANKPTETQRNLMAADDQASAIKEAFGGEEAFYNTDFSDPENYRKAYPFISKIEKLSDEQISEADKKKITDTRRLIALGDPAKNLTPDDTGLIDRTLKDVNKYFSDKAKGAAASSAHASFRNAVRNALFGAALTEAEIKSFNDAFGALGMQAGPALQMFKTALLQVKSDLQSTSNLMNPISAQVRLGADQAKMDTIMKALDARIGYIEAKLPADQRSSSEASRAATVNAFEGE